MMHPVRKRQEDGVSVDSVHNMADADLVEPIYCLEEKKRASLIALSQTLGEDGEWT